MVRTPVTSSNLASIGYDADSFVLEVEFRNGRIYRYMGVAPAHYANLLAASSVGNYFNSHIKDVFACVRA